MAFNMQDGNAEELPEQHDINVTPFIDVMLVLLIIFMVAAPLATVNVPVDLPSIHAPQQPQENEPLFITLQKDLTITLGETEKLSLEALTDHLLSQAIAKDQRILLRADSDVSYGNLIELMNTLAKAEYSKIALVGLESNSQ